MKMIWNRTRSSTERSISGPVVLVACVSFALTYLLAQSEVLEKSNEQRFLAPPPEHIEQFAFGFNSSMADSFWLRWIQDADFCQTYLAPKIVINAPDSKGQGTDPTDESTRFTGIRNKICEKSWGFKMLDAVTRLDPRFLMPYLTGAVTLSVLVEDYSGATVSFNRGLEDYPDDWSLAYRAAYHFLYDLQDLTRAASLLNRAADLGGPVWLKSLASRIYSRDGQFALGISTLEAFAANVTDPEAKKTVQKRIAELREKFRKESM